MRCPDCRQGTYVIDSRPTPDGHVRRRRECPAGHRFTTWEGIYKPDRRDRRAYFAARYAAMTPEQKRRKALRRAARAEALSTGEDVKLIYARWGCE